MKRIVAFFAIVLVLAGGLKAASVSPETAGIVARNFMDRQGFKGQLTMVDCMLPEMFLFAGADGGFVLVAGDDCVRPILGYSLTASVCTPLPENMTDWLLGYSDEIVMLRKNGVVASEQVRAEWTSTLENTPDMPVYSVVVQPMLTTIWKQGSPYNTFCPHDSLNRATKAGCVAIAMAQVMKYWNHPVQGVGSYSYSNANNGTVSANFGATTYDWANMPNSLTAASSTVNINAVAQLVFHVGVSVKMKYGYSSSGATTTSSNNLNTVTGERALRTYFKYDKALHSVRREAVGDSVWMALLDNELAFHRPVIVSGRDSSGGHAFVCDGRDNAGYYHINWGWGGYCDAYYQIGALNPAPGGDGANATSHYNQDNRIIIGIQPDTVSPGTYTLTAQPDNPSHGSVTGGGSYAYGDTVVLTALSDIHYRFSRWSDGMCYNPRDMIMSGDRTLYAIYDSVQGDTIGYDNGVYVNAWGYSTARPFYWGIKLDPFMLVGHGYLEAVQAYFKAGTYRLMVYGGSTPSVTTLADTLSFTTASEGWYTVPLARALAVDATKPLWLVLYNDNITYPACAGVYCGHQQAAYGCSDGASWSVSTSKRTFLIRGIFNNQPPLPVYDTLVVDACDSCQWQDSTFYNSGIYERRYETAQGADSVKVLVLTIHNSFSRTYDIVTDTAYTWVDGNSYSISGVYTIDTVTVHGCDSVLTLVLTVTNPQVGILAPADCCMLLYPNPTSGMLTIQADCVEAVDVYDVTGSCVLGVKAASWIDLSHLSNGHYMVRVRFTDGSSHAVSIIKQ